MVGWQIIPCSGEECDLIRLLDVLYRLRLEAHSTDTLPRGPLINGKCLEGSICIRTAESRYPPWGKV